MTTKQIKALLRSDFVSKSKGQFKFWESYFYRHGRTPEHLEQLVRSKIPSAVIIERGDHWHAFDGGAKSGSPKDSYLWVKFTA